MIVIPEQTIISRQVIEHTPLEYVLTSDGFSYEQWMEDVQNEIDRILKAKPSLSEKDAGRNVKAGLSIPRGLFLFDKPLVIPPNTSIYGEGPTSVIEFTKPGCGIVLQSEIGLVKSSDTEIANFVVYSEPNSDLIRVEGQHENLQFRRLRLKGFKGWDQSSIGIHFKQWNTDGVIDNCFFEGLLWGVAGQPGQDPRITNNKFQSCRGAINAFNMHYGCHISNNDIIAHPTWTDNPTRPNMWADTAILATGQHMVISSNRIVRYAKAALIKGSGKYHGNYISPLDTTVVDGYAAHFIKDDWRSSGRKFGDAGIPKDIPTGGNWQPAGPVEYSDNTAVSLTIKNAVLKETGFNVICK